MIKAYFNGIEKILAEQLADSNENILLAVAWFTNHQLFDIICSKLKKGIRVSICLVNDEINNRDLGLDFQHFISLGGELYFGNNEEFMHHKFCIIDKKTLINGSYNWTYYAEKKNRENVILIKELTEVIKDFMAEYEFLMASCDLITNVDDYIKANKPQHSTELSKYVNYDKQFQANKEQYSNVELPKISKSNFIENKETILDKEKVNANAKKNSIEHNDHSEINSGSDELREYYKRIYPSILENYKLGTQVFHVKDFNNNSECAIFETCLTHFYEAHRIACHIYAIERAFNYSIPDCYDPVILGCIMMLIHSDEEAKYFFAKEDSALVCYYYGLVCLLQKDLINFELQIKKTLERLNKSDELYPVIYLPNENNMHYSNDLFRQRFDRIGSYEINPITNKPSEFSLRETILQHKKRFVYNR